MILAPITLQSQSLTPVRNWVSDGRYSIQFSYQAGGVYKTNEFLSGKNAAGATVDSYQALSVRLARQTIGTKLWEQVYSYPRYGIGFVMGDFNFKELGKPMAVFGFLTGPVFRIKQFSLNYDYGIGLAFHWNKYDPVTNPYNIAIGSAINGMVEGGLAAEARIFHRVNISAGYGLTHFSNGGMTLPNKGVNNHFWKFGFRYELYSDNPIKPRGRIQKFKGGNEWLLAGYTGFRNADIPVAIKPDEKPPTIPVYAMGIFVTYHRKLDYRLKFGAGVHFGYNGLIQPQFEYVEDSAHLIRKPDIRRLEFSVFPSCELPFNRFSLLVEAGFSLYRNELLFNGPAFYQRLGFRYYFTDHIFAAVQLRARKFGKAEMIEWLIGYRF
ncbi:MAG: acyloxyacyl hydrolase [Bacteroidia bacterium]|nr:acyloxyacyl hydrolase [Bacteroidia bacterium]